MHVRAVNVIPQAGLGQALWSLNLFELKQELERASSPFCLRA